MKFHEFAQILYLHIGDNKSQSEFVYELFDNIVEYPPTDENGNTSTEINYNPVSDYKDDTLGRYFNGKPLSWKVALMEKAHQDKERFQDFLNGFSMDALEGIRNSFQEKMGINMNNIPEACAECFATIIETCADKGKNCKKEEQPVTSEDIPGHRDANLATNMCKSNEEIFDFFQDGFYRYGIKNFIEHEDPTVNLYFDSIINCEQFIKLINDGKWVPRSSALVEKRGYPFCSASMESYRCFTRSPR